MVRQARSASWVFSVLLALGLSATASAEVKRRSAKRCVRYGQKMEAGETGASLQLSNRCGFAVTCSIQWDLVCSGTSASRSSQSSSLDLDRGQSASVHASAAACEGDWEVANVRWSCDPVRGP